MKFPEMYSLIFFSETRPLFLHGQIVASQNAEFPLQSRVGASKALCVTDQALSGGEVDSVLTCYKKKGGVGEDRVNTLGLR